mmetsp:Transcript_35873/g.83153  ORF Transcript_35873/g.83153 Transcript_35873/m.83153 type:complete len:216 (-) Transcript_35873:927-1574(-)
MARPTSSSRTARCRRRWRGPTSRPQWRSAPCSASRRRASSPSTRSATGGTATTPRRTRARSRGTTAWMTPGASGGRSLRMRNSSGRWRPRRRRRPRRRIRRRRWETRASLGHPAAAAAAVYILVVGESAAAGCRLLSKFELSDASNWLQWASATGKIHLANTSGSWYDLKRPLIRKVTAASCCCQRRRWPSSTIQTSSTLSGSRDREARTCFRRV